MDALPLSRLAFLGTISELHLEPVSYDLARLGAIVADLSPDLLCAEITRAMWEGGELLHAAVEVREALAPVVAATDVVLVPVAPSAPRFADFAPEAGWRKQMVQTFDSLLRWGQRQAGTAEAVNGAAFGAFCHTVCKLTEWSWSAAERDAWNEQNEIIATNILEAVQRDPGRRVLVAVQCQRVHKLETLLARHDRVLEVVGFDNL